MEGQRLGEAAMAAALGPVAGIGINVLKGLQDMSQGQYARGLEAMLRLSDGRFIAIPEGRSYAMIWAGDPIEVRLMGCSLSLRRDEARLVEVEAAR